MDVPPSVNLVYYIHALPGKPPVHRVEKDGGYIWTYLLAFVRLSDYRKLLTTSL